MITKNLAPADFYRFLRQLAEYQKTILSIIEEGIQKNELYALDPKFCTQTTLASLRWIHSNFIRSNYKTNPVELEIQIGKILFGGLAP